MELTKQEFEKIKCINNNVLLRPYKNDGKYMLPNGKELIIDTTYEKVRHMTVTAEAIKYPEKIHYTLNKCLIDWKTENEIESGDKVYVRYSALLNPVTTFLYEGVEYCMVRYDNIVAVVKKSGEKYPINGFCFIEPVENEMKSSLLYLPDHLKKLPNKHVGVVRFMGKPNTEYFGIKNNSKIPIGVSDEWTHSKLKVGDTVVIGIPIELEFDKYRTFDGDRKLWRVQYRDIKCILPSSENVLVSKPRKKMEEPKMMPEYNGSAFI